MGQFAVRHKTLVALTGSLLVFVGAWIVTAASGESDARASEFVRFSAPAGNRTAVWSLRPVSR